MNVINTIPSYIITVTASVTFFVALKIMHNFVQHKIATAKTEQVKALWSYVEQLADTAVNSLVGQDLAGNEKFKQAMSIVQSQLNKQGFTNVDVKAIETAIQATYEKSPLTPTATPDAQPTTGVVVSQADDEPVMEAIKAAPNRANIKGD